MVDPLTTRAWLYRLLFVVLVLLLTFGQLLPLGMGAGKLPGPDLTIALAFAWVLRRPAYVPVPLLAALFLLLDLLLQRPPGLGTALLLLATEFLRSRSRLSRSQPFPLEWMLVTFVLLAMVGGSQLLLALTMVDRPPLGLALLRALFTAAAYPLVVLLSHYVLGVTNVDPAEADALGDRL